MSTKQANIQPEKIHIESIRIISGNIYCPDDYIDNNVKGFNTEFDLQQGVDFKQKLIRFLFSANFSAIENDGKKSKLTAEYKIEYIFIIENLDDFVIEHTEGKSLQLQEVLGTTLTGIVYSTSRGIILNRTQGTILSNGIILPVIDPRALLFKKDKEKPMKSLKKKK